MDHEDPEIQEDLGTGGKFKNWIQDNIRIIISVLIVVAIAGGIYSYSKRGENVAVQEDIILEENIEENDSAVAIIGEDEEDSEDNNEEKKDEVIEEDAVIIEEESSEEKPQLNKEEVVVVEEEAQPVVEEDMVAEKPQQEEEPKKETQENEKKEDTKVDTGVSEGISQETDDAFTETAVKGDSITTLARKALKSYLEKNQDSSLTPEQKIYIEDYLRKAIKHSGSLQPGNSISFSKIMIKDGIEKAKTLNEAQLDNLKKYSASVSGL